MSWNSTIDAGRAVSFGIQGTGSVADTLDITVE